MLNLANNGLSHVHVEALARQTVATLKVLNLSFNLLGDRSRYAMSTLLQRSPKLTSLSLSSCRLTCDFASPAQTVKSLEQLEDLDLSYNRLGIRGLCDIMLILKSSSAIQNINFSGCVKMSRDETKLMDVLLDFQASVSTLQRVTLAHNRLNELYFPSSLRDVVSLK